VQRILVVEDNEQLRRQVVRLLTAEFDVVEAATIEEARRRLHSAEFDLVLLDGSLPDGDGFQLCAALQADARTRDLPVVMLTSRGGIEDKIMAFSLGADDFIAKPFEARELLARVRAKLSRAARRRQHEEVVVRGGLRLEVPFQRVTLDNARLDVTPLEFKLLLFLSRHELEVLARERILQEVWGGSTHVGGRTVDTHVSSLRRKIAGCGYEIVSIHGEGYSFRKSEAGPAQRSA
jgi:two-component system phosphate regulon response regulator PhoB